MKYLYSLCFSLVAFSAFAQEVTNPINTTFNDALGDAIITGIQAHPGAVASIVGLWTLQTVIKAILATTTTKDVWWYKGLEIIAGIVGKVKQPVIK